MTIPEFLDFIEQVETRISHFENLVINSCAEQRQALLTRCESAKETVLNDIGDLKDIEQSPQLCLTIALGSYLLHLNHIFLLNLPTELQDWLFYDSVRWIQVSPHEREHIDRYLMARITNWQKWVAIQPKFLSSTLRQKLVDELVNAFERTKRFLKVTGS